MTAAERRAGVALAFILALRMLGLFLVLPVFSVFARTLPGGDNIFLAGLAFGVFGLSQAVMQIPFGIASDRFGRKPVIVSGLLLYAAGSLMAMWAPDIHWMIAARVLQGTGAISAAVTALAADLVRDQHRTKVMAMIGSTIGLVFAGSLVLSPALYGWVGMDGMFLFIAVLALLAIPVLLKVVPDPDHAPAVQPTPFARVIADGQLMRLNFGMFTVHMVQMAMFLLVPLALVELMHIPVSRHWTLYLPIVLASFVVMVPAIIWAEKRARMKPLFLASIVILIASQIIFLLQPDRAWMVVGGLFVFFAAFNLLEALLPSLVSRIAPPAAKGAALGVFNTAQSMGAATGSAIGGAIALRFGAGGVFAFCLALAVVWWLWARSMQAPPVVALREYAIGDHVDLDWLRDRLLELPGVREASVEKDRRMAYLKVNLEMWDEEGMRRLLDAAATA
ncbi:MFS transporter [Methyloversatilis thermotolerans]|uniref:MFS transporter n=1 Tax=Methyloversatilis thermotolerans TaxID=1346290 RepID=UPI000372A17B|nr:MFS transporter [Methyloversatilis thermotolerans]